MQDLFIFHQKWRNFENSYFELHMSKFEIESTVTKLVTATFIIYLCMSPLMTEDGGDKGKTYLYLKLHTCRPSKSSMLIKILFWTQKQVSLHCSLIKWRKYYSKFSMIANCIKWPFRPNLQCGNVLSNIRVQERKITNLKVGEVI